MSEKILQNSILMYLNLSGIFCWQTDSTGLYDPIKKTFRSRGKFKIKGVSDILGILPDGRFLAIEVKYGKNKTTPEQKDFINKIIDRNGIAFVAYSLEDVIGVLRELHLLHESEISH